MRLSVAVTNTTDGTDTPHFKNKNSKIGEKIQCISACIVGSMGIAVHLGLQFHNNYKTLLQISSQSDEISLVNGVANHNLTKTVM